MTTSALARLQSDFQAHLLGHDTGCARGVRPGPGIDPHARLHIYHHAYRARLVAALRDVHGHTARLLGDDGFDTLGFEFVETHAPAHSSLRWYGAEFPDWLAVRGQPEIAELARLDAALRRAFDGPDATPLDLASLAGIDAEAWPRIVFVPHPTCARLGFMHNTIERWHALDQEQAPPCAMRLAVPTDVLVWRSGLKPHFRSLGAFECEALDGLFAGLGFAAICDRLAARHPSSDIAAEAGRLLRRWIDDGLLCAARAAAPLSPPPPAS